MSRRIESQREQWPLRMADIPPSFSDVAEEEWERRRRQQYPRGFGPPLQGEDDPRYLDPEGASLDDHDPGRLLADPGFADDELEDWAEEPDPDHMLDYRHHMQSKPVGPRVATLGPDEHLVWRDPAYIDPQGEGHTYPHSMVGGDPPGTVSVRPREEAGPDDAFVMPDSESGLGYDAIVRRSPDGRGYDVIRPLDRKQT